MKTKPEKSGYTLIEMIVTVVIIVILITLTVKVGSRIENKAKEKLTKETINIIDAALAEFRDFEYKYRFPAAYTDYESYNKLKFPLDCNSTPDSSSTSFSQVNMAMIIREALGDINIVTLQGNDYHKEDSGCQMMCFWLNKVTASRVVLKKIDDSLIKAESGQRLEIINANNTYPWIKIVDAWGTTLNYSYYDNEKEEQPSDSGADKRLDEPKVGKAREFPIVTSAGPDGEFGTVDDITNR